MNDLEAPILPAVPENGRRRPNATALATASRTDFTEEQVGLIKRTIAIGSTDDELTLFLRQCRRTGLDPFARQIYFMKRSGKLSIETAIDGYRLIADRSGAYAGNDDPVFDNENAPTKATVTVYKLVNGVRCPFTATARWSQYFPGDKQGFMWKKMPHLMLGKCAEALALRKAFPAELSGLYISEEMQQAGEPDDKPVRPQNGQLILPDNPHPVPLLLSEEQIADANAIIFDLREEGEYDADEFFAYVRKMPGCHEGIDDLRQVPASCYERVLLGLKHKLKAVRAGKMSPAAGGAK